MVPCTWVVEVVTDYLEGALAPAARRALHRHLRTCVGCTTYLSQMRSTIRLAGWIRH